jgi:UPF0271 protein
VDGEPAVTRHVALERFGDAALRARLPPETDARRLLAALRAIAGVRDAVVSEQHALVTFEPGHPPAGLAEAIAGASAVGAPSAGALVSIAVRYDGEDLASVASAVDLTETEVAVRHAAAEYTVAAIGFMPGFAYLRGLDPRLVTARRATPRPRVPALAVGIAGPYSGVYPFASPGGWNLLGTAVGFVPFDPATGARLAIGDRVRFVPVDGGTAGGR